MNHVLRSCHSHEKIILIVTQIRISAIHCISTMCQAVDSIYIQIVREEGIMELTNLG